MGRIEWVWKYHTGHRKSWYDGYWSLRDGKHDGKMKVMLRSKTDRFIPGGNPVDEMEPTLWYTYGAGLTEQFIDDVNSLFTQHEEEFLSIERGEMLIQMESIE